MDNNLNTFRDYLSRLRPGAISDTSRLERLLASCWKELHMDSLGGMEPDKLYGRMESIFWEPPFLTFNIERHGGTVCGSARAELQLWTIDADRDSASYTPVGHRQVHPMQQKLDVQPMADEIAGLIVQGRCDPRLKWCPDRQVRVLIGQVLPERTSPKQTREGRRRRFRQALRSALSSKGWTELPHTPNTHRPPDL